MVASDSRLRGPYVLDCAPKILTLSRGDAAISFNGSTAEGYPMMLQMSSAIDSFQKSRDRALDLCELKGHSLRIFNSMWETTREFVSGYSRRSPDITDAGFLLAGYSWKLKTFKIWKAVYNPAVGEFRFVKRGPSVPGQRRYLSRTLPIQIAGDYTDEFEALLAQKLEGKDLSTGLDMEPFEVLRDMLREDLPHRNRIGGPIQIVKVYPYMNSIPICVNWPTANDPPTLLGRTLLDYEAPDLLVMDPDTLETKKLHKRIGVTPVIDNLKT